MFVFVAWDVAGWIMGFSPTSAQNEDHCVPKLL